MMLRISLYFLGTNEEEQLTKQFLYSWPRPTFS